MHIPRLLLLPVVVGAHLCAGAPNLPPRTHTSTPKRQLPSNPRADAVKEVFLHSWNGYVKYAFGHDELAPVSNEGQDSRNGWGATIVDALSTAILMQMSDVVVVQLEHIQGVDFTKTKDSVSLFETTIRYLGGLLSGYDLLKGPYSNLLPADKQHLVGVLLSKAVVLADALSFAFNTPTGIPANNLNFTSRSFTDRSNGLATTGTLVLEWTRLSDLTGNQTYAKLAQRAESYLLNPKPASGEPFPGLLGGAVDIRSGEIIGSSGGWSGGSDSFYEYLIKMWIYEPGKYEVYKQRWITAADSTILHLTSYPAPSPSIAFLAEYSSSTSLSLNSGHLTCFAGGNFLLAGAVLSQQKYTDYGLSLTASCHHTYASTPSHIGPERWSWDQSSVPQDQRQFFQDHGFWITASYYDLRPEVIESYYHAFVATRDRKYQDWAWDALVAINASARTPSGFTAVGNVGEKDGGQKLDRQESFWFAEVLKYLFLIFTDGDEGGNAGGTVGFVKGEKQGWVLNTEAHPLKVQSSSSSPSSSSTTATPTPSSSPNSSASPPPPRPRIGLLPFYAYAAAAVGMWLVVLVV